MLTLDTSLPYNEQAEAIILGAILIDNDHIASVAEILGEEDFYITRFRAFYGAMLALYSQGQGVTALGVQETLRAQGNEKSMTEILQLTTGLPPISNLDEYVEVVRQKSLARKLIRSCSAAVATTMSQSESVNEIIDKVEQDIFKLRDINVREAPQLLAELVSHSLDDVLERAKLGMTTLGLQTGFRDVDRLTGGLQNTDLIIVAARPSMGKSAFSLDICKGVTQKDPEAVVAYFSLEMSKRQCADRLICSMARVDSGRYRIGHLTPSEWARVGEACDTLKRMRIMVDDKSASSVLDIKSKARRIASGHGRLDLIVIDYLQLMRGSTKTDNRQQEVSDISRDLKSLAKDLGVPVVALSQLSRQCEARQDKRPLLSDLRESGAIEQDADVVAFLYRDEYYNPPTPETAGMAELIFRKHRHGATDTINLAFFKEFAQFGNRSNYGEN
jgi:replicative DNA helicase